MKLNTDIKAGVYEDADFHRDFAAAMRKAGCTLPVEKVEPSGASEGNDMQGVCTS